MNLKKVLSWVTGSFGGFCFLSGLAGIWQLVYYGRDTFTMVLTIIFIIGGSSTLIYVSTTHKEGEVDSTHITKTEKKVGKKRK